jgi:hypothetical protein
MKNARIVPRSGRTAAAVVPLVGPAHVEKRRHAIVLGYEVHDLDVEVRKRLADHLDPASNRVRAIKDESSGSSQPIVGESATGNALTPGCEKGTLVSGGIRSTPISEASLMFVFTSRREGDRWAATAIQGLEGPGALTSIGYCA